MKTRLSARFFHRFVTFTALLALVLTAPASSSAVSDADAPSGLSVGTSAPSVGIAAQSGGIAAQYGANRFNVCIVLDTSGSMKLTDPSGYRYDAVNQFVHLLSEQGDTLGGITFSAGIDSASAPSRMEGRAAKEVLADALRRVPADGGYTNIGLALTEAVRQLKQHGDPALPSVVLLLSDGNTDMDTTESRQQSLEQKADAIQEARESGIKIYGVCLNVENDRYHADPAEMDQISRGTGGVSVEVTRAEDLREVFNAFYDMIYGTSTTTVVDEVFPPDGTLETRFDVPQVGVEEVNIIINGHTRRIALLNPSGGDVPLNGSDVDGSAVDGSGVNGSAVDGSGVNGSGADDSAANGSAADGSGVGVTASRYDAEGFTMLKLPNAAPGPWTLVTEGVPGDQIKVNMVYNSSLSVELSMDPDEDNIDVAQHVTFTAALREADDAVVAAEPAPVASEDGTPNQDLILYPASPLAGYEARLNVKNAQREVLRREAMVPEGGAFLCSTNFREGTYYFTVTVTGQYLTRESEEIGPVNFGNYVINTAPVPVPEGGRVTEDIPVYPFGKDPSYTVDLSTLATDPEGGELRFEIVSTPFIEGQDYRIENNVLTLDHFSIHRGGFTVRAVDEYGLSCDVEVVVRTHNVGLIALLGTVLAALAGLVLLYVLYDRLFPPFRGEITVYALIDGEARPSVSRNPQRGKCPLSAFQTPDIGLDPDKSYFKATGGREIRFLPSRPVTCNGLDSTEVRVLSGAEVSVCVGGNYDRRLFIRFDSRVPARRRGGYGGGRPPVGGYGGRRTVGGHARPTGGGRPSASGRSPYSGGRRTAGGRPPYGG